MIFEIFITLFLVFLNGFFVAAEFAIVKVRSSQLELKAQAGHSRAKLAKHITSHLDGYLAATQLGITLASLALGWIGEPVVSKLIIGFMELINIQISPELAHNIALPISFAVISILHIVFGELAPKSIAIQRSEGTTLAIAYPLQFFYILFKPGIWMLNGIANVVLKGLGIAPTHGSEVHSSDELKYLVLQGRDEGTIEAADYDIIKNAFDFSERTAKQVMIPRTQVMAIDVTDFNETTIEKIVFEGYSRIPCYEDTLDNIVGVIYLKDLLMEMRKQQPIQVKTIMRTVEIVPESKKVGKLLKDFQTKHQQIAIVVNEFGGTSGIITMEDILEELVGEIQDEYDTEVPVVEQNEDKSFNVMASAHLDDINELLPYSIEKDEQYETLAGYLILKFGRIPNTNDKIVAGNYEFTILKKSKNSIVMVKIKVNNE